MTLQHIGALEGGAAEDASVRALGVVGAAMALQVLSSLVALETDGAAVESVGVGHGGRWVPRRRRRRVRLSRAWGGDGTARDDWSQAASCSGSVSASASVPAPSCRLCNLARLRIGLGQAPKCRVRGRRRLRGFDFLDARAAPASSRLPLPTPATRESLSCHMSQTNRLRTTGSPSFVRCVWWQWMGPPLNPHLFPPGTHHSLLISMVQLLAAIPHPPAPCRNGIQIDSSLATGFCLALLVLRNQLTSSTTGGSATLILKGYRSQLPLLSVAVRLGAWLMTNVMSNPRPRINKCAVLMMLVTICVNGSSTTLWLKG
jgi:hypothetical protein